MAGYSGKPLLEKLGIRPEHRVGLVRRPAPLPVELRDVAVAEQAEALDVVLLFAESRTEFESAFATWMRRMKADGMIWVAWPKKASGRKTDLSENVIRDHALKTPLVDVKVCAIDDTWSGLKLVVRKEHRKGWSQATR
ncbi:DUF3052 domain-containing protein [Acidicapsa dinghuensis]|uniref:DUF3052 domain-containing protein n=1 Tax=Acidicapsa dinghuensis TaxID=2218256 RepID=A0ABW1EBI3_9BACT|nr:DUF3052 domain-containing protein [Acidicapsa dinghuensis]